MTNIPLSTISTKKMEGLFSDNWLAGHSSFQVPLLVLCWMGAMVLPLINMKTIILGWRPTDMASIALNFYRHGFHFLYPEVNWGGNGPGFVETEFPLIPFATAVLYKLFGVHEWLDLVLPMISGLGLVLVIFFFARFIFGATAGLVAGLFVAVSPTLATLSSGLWPDPPMVFCGALGLYGLARWVKEDSFWYFVLGALGVTLAILLKLTALYLGIPVLFLCIVKYGSSWWRRVDVCVLGALILLPPVLWYWHAYDLYRDYHNTFGILSGGYLKFGTLQILTNGEFWFPTLARLVMYHITPAACAALIAGLALHQEDRLQYVFHVWFGALVLYTLVSARGIMIGHYQYLLPFVPPSAALAGAGAIGMLRRLESRPPKGLPIRRGIIAFVALTVFFANGVLATVLFHSQGIRTISAFWEGDKRTGLAVGSVTPPESLIVVADGQMDEVAQERSMTPPNVFYFSGRRGWYLSLAWISPERIEGIKNQGARYFVVTGNALKEFDGSYAGLARYFSSTYKEILRSNDGRVFDLTCGPSGHASN